MDVPLLITDGDIAYFIAGDTPVTDCTLIIKHFSVIDYAIYTSIHKASDNVRLLHGDGCNLTLEN